MRRRADPRLPAYLLAGFGALAGAVLTGEPQLVALGAPFIALSAMGLVDRKSIRVEASVSVEPRQVIEGDWIEGRIEVDWEGEAEVDLLLAGSRGVTPVDPGPVVGWALPSGPGPAHLSFRVLARSWGDHPLGVLWARARRPGGLVVWEGRVAEAPSIRIVPQPVHLDRLLQPAEPRRVAGVHLSKARGQGTDFAELRPYQPGDRLRNLSWATSARFGEPWVTVHHPERTGTVLLLLDTFLMGRERRPEAWARAARTAWAVASVHLRAQDRVGLLARGRTTAWLAPQGGRRARARFMNELLAIGEVAEAPGRSRRSTGRVFVPPDALVVGITDLRSRAFLPRLHHLRRVGHAVGALVIDTSDLQADATDRTDAAARRIWHEQREMERRRLHAVGIQTALVPANDGLGSAVSTLRRRMSVARRTHRGGLRSGGFRVETST